MSFRAVARLDEIPDGGVLLVTVAQLRIGLFRVGRTVRAWRDFCPHMGAPVCRGVVTGTMVPSPVYEYEAGRLGEILQCPWHGWEFDLHTGRHLAAGSRARLRGYPTRVSDGVVSVELRSSEPGAPVVDVARSDPSAGS